MELDHPRRETRSWPGGIRLAARAHQLLLKCYPAEFQEEFGFEMQAFFEERCLEVHGRRATGGLAPWLVLSALDGIRSAAREHRDRMVRGFQSRPGAPAAFGLGLAFLIGSWAAAVLTLDSLPVGLAWVLLNAVLAGRALLKSARFENVPGMAAIANLALIAVSIGLTGARARLPVLEPGLTAACASLILAGLAWTHAHLLWRLRGEALERGPAEEI